MAPVMKALVGESSTSTGTGAIALAAALTEGGVTTHRRFSAVCSVGDTVEYMIRHATDGTWEAGTGTYSAANTLTRTTVSESSNANAAVSFAAGGLTVVLTPLASRLASVFDPASPGAIGGTTPNTVTGTKLTATGGTVTTSSPVVDVAQTWNAGAVAFTGKVTNITSTASAAGSLIEEWRVNGNSALAIRKDGQLVIGGQTSAAINAYGNAVQLGGDAGVASSKMDIGGNGENRVGIASNVVVAWATSTAAGYYTSVDTGLAKNATGIVEVNSGTKGTLRDLTLRNLIGTGNLATGLVTKTASYTSTANDGTALFNASAGACVYTLETAIGCAGRIKVVVKIDSSANTVTTDPNATETVNGASTLVLSAQWDRAVLQSDGANWIRIA